MISNYKALEDHLLYCFKLSANWNKMNHAKGIPIPPFWELEGKMWYLLVIREYKPRIYGCKQWWAAVPSPPRHITQLMCLLSRLRPPKRQCRTGAPHNLCVFLARWCHWIWWSLRYRQGWTWLSGVSLPAVHLLKMLRLLKSPGFWCHSIWAGFGGDYNGVGVWAGYRLCGGNMCGVCVCLCRMCSVFI